MPAAVVAVPRVLMRATLTLVIVFFLVVTLGPLYWVAVSSFKPPREVIARIPTAFPSEVTLKNYERLLDQSNFVAQLQNSATIAVLTVVFTVVIVVLAAFGAYRGHTRALRKLKLWRFWPSSFTTLLVVPIYEILVRIGLIDTIWSGVLVNCILTVPFSFWLIEGFFDPIPRELEEAAYVDGRQPLAGGVRSCCHSLRQWLASRHLLFRDFMDRVHLRVSAAHQRRPQTPAAGWRILAQYNINWGC